MKKQLLFSLLLLSSVGVFAAQEDVEREQPHQFDDNAIFVKLARRLFGNREDRFNPVSINQSDESLQEGSITITLQKADGNYTITFLDAHKREREWEKKLSEAQVRTGSVMAQLRQAGVVTGNLADLLRLTGEEEASQTSCSGQKGAKQESRPEQEYNKVGIATVAIVGTGIAIWGVKTWLASSPDSSLNNPITASLSL